MDIDSLNDKQKEALLYNEGPLLILAGAGSGKTKVVTSKIAYLIENEVPSWRILAITFTNKAAREMRERVAMLIDEDVSPMWIGTFHAICVRILRKNIENLGYGSNYNIYDRADQNTIIKESYKELNINKEIYNSRTILSKISSWKNEELTPSEVLDGNKEDIFNFNAGKIYEFYQNKLKENNALDFDDLLIKTVELLREFPDVREFYQNKFKYIFVDEYQDTNSIQYKLIKLFCGKAPNLTVVGDNDQSIYKWRGADISNILNFQKDFPGAKIIKLEQNYRSTQNILDVANSVIKNNPQELSKSLWTKRQGGEKVYYKEFSVSNEEEFAVTNKILGLNYKGYSFEDMAILYRTNAQSRGFEESLSREGINYKIVGGLRFYDRAEVKDIMAYLKVINNPLDEIALLRIINKPKRGIGDSSIEKIRDYAINNNLSMFEVIKNIENYEDLNVRAKKNIKSFANLINLLIERKDSLNVGELAELVVDESQYVEDLKNQNTLEARTKISNIDELISNIMSYDKETSLSDYLSNMSLLTDIDKTSDAKGINLMTVHAAKGLEFKIVFLVGMEEGLFPIIRQDEDENIEEERRLCYVAITRAEDLLFISSSKTRYLYGKMTPKIKSRFINEMQDTIEIVEEKNQRLIDVIDYSGKIDERITTYKKVQTPNKSIKSVNVGDKVKHKIFGQGMVVQKKEKNGDIEVVVSFENKGLKKLLLSVAPIEVID